MAIKIGGGGGGKEEDMIMMQNHSEICGDGGDVGKSDCGRGGGVCEKRNGRYQIKFFLFRSIRLI